MIPRYKISPSQSAKEFQISEGIKEINPHASDNKHNADCELKKDTNMSNESLLDSRLKFPQSIAHRGLKAQYPENTMSSFIAAVEAGTHALETDIHLTRDNVVVLSHDPTLLRCFGVDKKIIDCDYEYIQTLRTLQSPPEEMPTFKDLLRYLRKPEANRVWLLLDIKLDNDPVQVMKLIAEALADVGGEGATAWGGRVTLGIWALKYISLCEQFLPGFPITHIGASVTYAREFLKFPHISFNMHYATLANACGKKFVNDARKAGREVFAWTVNDERLMKWAICYKLDGVCVDDVIKYLRVCNSFDPNTDCRSPSWGWKMELELKTFTIMGWVISYLIRLKYCGGMKGLILGREKKVLEQYWQAGAKARSRIALPVEIEDSEQALVAA